MLILVEGTDYIWKKATIDFVRRTWEDRGNKVTTIWGSEHEPSWVASYVTSNNNLIIRQADNLGEMLDPYLKPNRDKNWLFEAEMIPASTFKRRVQRIGKWVRCEPGTDEGKTKITDVVRKLGYEPDIIKYFMTMTDAYQTLMFHKLAGKPFVPAKRESQVWDIVYWRPSLSLSPVKEIVHLIGGLARLVNLTNQNANKWRLVQECLRISPRQVSELYGGSVHLVNDQRLLYSLMLRAKGLSVILEEEPDPPSHYIYFKLSNIEHLKHFSVNL